MPFQGSARSLDSITPQSLAEGLAALIPHGFAARSRRDGANPHFTAPTGQSHPIRYDGEEPVLAIRVQELFGLKTHPSVAGGRLPLLLELTSPAHRPIQTTRDLPGFWAGSWRDVRAGHAGGAIQSTPGRKTRQKPRRPQGPKRGARECLAANSPAPGSFIAVVNMLYLRFEASGIGNVAARVAPPEDKMKSEFGSSSRRLRLQTLVRLRWLAVAGQALTVVIVAEWLTFPLPLHFAALLIGGLAAANLLLATAFPPTHRLEPLAASALLGFDLLQLAALLFITGGLANPFAPLICVPVIISFASQPLRHSTALLLLAMLAVSALVLTPYPMPWYEDQQLTMQPVIQFATWCSIVSMMAFAAFYAYRVSQEAVLLADALQATELVLQQQNHLSQLDGLAAAAAHELGTPLATISVVAREMERELGDDPRFGEDVHLLRSQSERCRDISDA